MNGLLGRIFAAAGETARARERLRACLSELPQEQVDPTLYATFAFDYYRQLAQDESASKEAQVWLQAGKRASAQAEYRRPLQEYPEAEAYDAATVQALSFLQQ